MDIYEPDDREYYEDNQKLDDYVFRIGEIDNGIFLTIPANQLRMPTQILGG